MIIVFGLITLAYAAHTNNWDETSPSNATLATSIDDEIVKVRQDIRERFAVDHKAAVSDDALAKWGVHKQITFEQRISTPSEPPGAIATLYLKAADRDSEIRFADVNNVDNKIVFVGEVRMVLGSTVPTGWLPLNGTTIGDASSGADYASAIYEDLFLYLWAECGQTECEVVGGRSGDAATDWASHKELTMPDARCRMVIGAGSSAGLTTRLIGDTGGDETKDLTHDHGLNSHTHGAGTHTHTLKGSVVQADKSVTSTDPVVWDEAKDHAYVDTGSYNISGGNDVTYLGTSGGNTGVSAGNTAAATGNTATGASATQDVMNPWFALRLIIKF